MPALIALLILVVTTELVDQLDEFIFIKCPVFIGVYPVKIFFHEAGGLSGGDFSIAVFVHGLKPVGNIGYGSRLVLLFLGRAKERG